MSEEFPTSAVVECGRLVSSFDISRIVEVFAEARENSILSSALECFCNSRKDASALSPPAMKDLVDTTMHGLENSQNLTMDCFALFLVGYACITVLDCNKNKIGAAIAK